MATYVRRSGQQLGPFADDRVQSALQDGTFSPEDPAWREGMVTWVTLRELYSAPPRPPSLPTGPAPPPPLPTGSAPPQTPPLPPGGGPARPHLGDDAGVRFLLPVGRSGWAIAAGYLGLFGLVILPAPLALIVSLIAIRDILLSRQTPRPKYGMGRAIFALIVGAVGTGILMILIGLSWFGRG